MIISGVDPWARLADFRIGLLIAMSGDFHRQATRRFLAFAAVDLRQRRIARRGVVLAALAGHSPCDSALVKIQAGGGRWARSVTGYCAHNSERKADHCKEPSRTSLSEHVAPDLPQASIGE